MRLTPAAVLFDTDEVAVASGSISVVLDAVAERVSTRAVEHLVVRIAGGAHELRSPLNISPSMVPLNGSLRFVGDADGSTVLDGSSSVEVIRVDEQGLWHCKASASGLNPSEVTGARELFVAGKRLPVARMPRSGYYSVGGTLNPELRDAPENASGFRFTGDEFADVDVSVAQLVILHRWDSSRLSIASVDLQKRIVRLARNAQRPIISDRRFQIEHDARGLVPGSWCRTSDSEVFLYSPRERDDPDSTVLRTTVCETLISVSGTQGNPVPNLSFESITFARTNWEHEIGEIEGERRYKQAAVLAPATVSVQYARDILFHSCRFEDTGGYALDLSRGVVGSTVENCTFERTGAGAVRVGSRYYPELEQDSTRSFVISDNAITHVGQVYPDAVAVLVLQASDGLVTHNDIGYTTYTAISVGWDWTFSRSRTHHVRIECNHIHDLCQNVLTDAGGVYILGVQPGTVIRRNHIHDVSAYGKNSGRGVYLDESSCGIVVEENLVHDTSGPCIRLQNGTLGNIIRNNIFAFSETAVLGFDTDRANVFQYNIVVCGDSKLFRREEWVNFDKVHQSNLYWRTDGAPVEFLGHTLDQWQQLGPEQRTFWRPERMDEASVVADPRFRSLEERDFTLLPSSPAPEVGFRSFDLTTGPRSNSTRKP